MSGFSKIPGEIIPLSAQLTRFMAGKYARAKLTTVDGTEIVGSPVDLVDRGNGLYSIDTYTMPNHDVIATYMVYEDAAFTQLIDGEAAQDVIVVNSTDVPRITEHIVAEMEDDDTFIAIMEDSEDFIATIDNDDFVADYIDDDSVQYVAEFQDNDDYLAYTDC